MCVCACVYVWWAHMCSFMHECIYMVMYTWIVCNIYLPFMFVTSFHTPHADLNEKDLYEEIKWTEFMYMYAS